MRWVNECKTKQPISKSDSMVLGHLINQLIINEILVKLTEIQRFQNVYIRFLELVTPWISNEQ